MTRVDHLRLLADVGDLAAKLAGSADVRSFLQRIVQMVAERLPSDVCSIYLYEDRTRELVLRATRGLRDESVDRVRMKIGEGLTGLALKELRPICEDCASRSPGFVHFPDTGEERYESFLAVPILKGLERIGVLVVQRQQRQPFTGEDVAAMRATASQLAGVVENARIVMGLRAPAPPRPAGEEDLSLVEGDVASPGFAYGPAALEDPTHTRRVLAERTFQRRHTLQEFHDALARTARQLEDLQAHLDRRLPEVASLIFDAHLMMLKDPAFTGKMAAAVEAGQNPPEAVLAVGRHYVDLFAASDHAYMREKAQDVEDLLRRLLGNLTGADEELAAEDVGKVLIARELFPSDVLKLASANVAGAVVVSGGATSHVSILARSMQLPLVIAPEPRLLQVPPGTLILLDGETGRIHVAPCDEVVANFRRQRHARARIEPQKATVRPTTTTADGTRVRLLANINLLGDLKLARDVKAEGVGLYRSEMPFLVRSNLPSEDEQHVLYRRLIQEMDGREVTFRTLDIGGEKLLAYYHAAAEDNPALGLRSIRFSLSHRDVFTQQLRAILRAADDGSPLRIMFPMISSLDEFLQARQIVRDCIALLGAEGIACHERPGLGVMVEVPSAVEIIDALADEADFLSVGTNDLVQFLLAADRGNENVACWYTPHHPAVLRALKKIADAGASRGKEVALCGEMAHQVEYLPFLLGIGIRTLSVDPHWLPAVQRHLAVLSLADARREAEDLLRQTTVRAVTQRLYSV